MRHIVLTALLAAPLPLMAQNLAAEYVGAARVFALPGETNDMDAQLGQARDRALAIEGLWLPAWQILAGWGSSEHLGQLAEVAMDMSRYCDGIAFRGAATGPTSFAMYVVSRGTEQAFARRFQYVGGRSYQVSVDELALLDRLGFTDGREPLASIYFSGQNAGFVEVFTPSANVLVIQGLGAQPEIYLRCPG